MSGHCRELHHANRKQHRNSLAMPLQSILQEVEESPIMKTKVLHLFRYTLCIHTCMTVSTTVGFTQVLIADIQVSSC